VAGAIPLGPFTGTVLGTVLWPLKYCRCSMPFKWRPPQDDAPPSCDKCGQATELLSLLPRVGPQPAYRILECLSCRALKWIAEPTRE
jgi:hypothetical protein